MSIGERIKSARKEAGMTQRMLAEKLNISPVNISQLESDQRSPSVETLIKIARALDTSISELIGTTPPPDREYELLCDTLNRAGISVEANGFNDGTGPDGDYYLVWHTEDPEMDGEKPLYRYGDLLAIVRCVNRDAEVRRDNYICKRLEAELF